MSEMRRSFVNLNYERLKQSCGIAIANVQCAGPPCGNVRIGVSVDSCKRLKLYPDRCRSAALRLKCSCVTGAVGQQIHFELYSNC